MIKSFYQYLCDLWKNQQRGRFALSLLGAISIAVCLLILLIWVVENLLAFIVLKFDLIFITLSFIGLVLYIWSTKRKEKVKKELEIQDQKSAQAIEIERAVAENNYTIIRQCLFSVLIERAEMVGLVVPRSLSELNSPTRIIPRNGFMLCQYVAMKKGCDIDLKLVKECLQMRIIQKLNAGEFEELSIRNHVYKGQAYPILYIDDITDAGGYIQINATLANDAFCQHIENKSHAQMHNTVHKPPSPKDDDF